MLVQVFLQSSLMIIDKKQDRQNERLRSRYNYAAVSFKPMRCNYAAVPFKRSGDKKEG